MRILLKRLSKWSERSWFPDPSAIYAVVIPLHLVAEITLLFFSSFNKHTMIIWASLSQAFSATMLDTSTCNFTAVVVVLLTAIGFWFGKDGENWVSNLLCKLSLFHSKLIGQTLTWWKLLLEFRKPQSRSTISNIAWVMDLLCLNGSPLII